MSFASETRWREVIISAGASFFGSFGSFMVMTALILALQERGADGLQVAALVVCEALPLVLLGKAIGAAVDRFDSRRLIVAAGAAQVLTCLALTQATSLASVLGGAVALSVATGVAQPTRQALIPGMITRDDLPRVTAIGQTAASAGMMLGPALAGVLVGGLGVGRTIAVAAGLFFGTVAAGLTLRTRRRGGQVAGQPVAAPPRTPWTLRADRLLWSAAWGLTAVVAVIGANNVVLVFFVMRTLDGTEQQYGLLDATWTVGVVAGGWLFSRFVRPTTPDRSLARRLFVALGLVCVAIVAVALVAQAWWIVPIYLLGGTQNGGLNMLAGTLLLRRAPAAARGRASTALTIRIQGGAMVGMIAGGLLLAVAEARSVILGCGVLGAIVVAAAAPLVLRSAAKEPAPASRAESALASS